MSICIIVPSRGRPERAQAMVDSARATMAKSQHIVVAVDPDDPRLAEYEAISGAGLCVLEERIGYTATLNLIAAGYWDDYTILGAFGDDVLFRTPGWDLAVEQALRVPGMAYGDDKVHGRGHPTAVWMSSVTAKSLGWLALPVVRHQWADDGWKNLGVETGLYHYLPEVVVEHMHPAVGKAEWDATYESVFSDEQARHDYEAFTAWRDGPEFRKSCEAMFAATLR